MVGAIGRAIPKGPFKILSAVRRKSVIDLDLHISKV